jgi:adenine-specific DNA-methyltransferase
MHDDGVIKDRESAGSDLASAFCNNKGIRSNTELLASLRAALPQYFDAQGSFKTDMFTNELQANNIAEARDGYRLSFAGKDYARLQSGLPAQTMLIPDGIHNARGENKQSGNIFITGDNLEALRHLQNAYAGMVKVIYLDPPYNTGKEFVYSDRFEFTDEKLKTVLGYSDEEIERLKSIQGKSSHSAWLTFMYPRLKLAQKLLSNTGIIFVSIDDNEQANLKLLMDDVFGEGNCVAVFIVVRSEGGGLAKQAVIGHDYLLAYSKNRVDFVPLRKPKDIRGKIVTLNNEDYWIETDWLRKEFGKYGTCLYEEIIKYHGQSKKDEIDKGINDGIYTLVKKDAGHIVGRYRKLSEDTSKFYTILKHLNKKGNADLRHLALNNCFDFPKPVDLCKELILGATIKDKSALILDFFAGSATTAHAVMQLNAEDGGNRKFIMVQLDEPTNPKSEARKAGYNTIDEIARERIKRAARKIVSGGQWTVVSKQCIFSNKILEEYGCIELSKDELTGQDLQTDKSSAKERDLFSEQPEVACGSSDTGHCRSEVEAAEQKGGRAVPVHRQQFENGPGNTAVNRREDTVPCRYGYFSSDAFLEHDRRKITCPYCLTKNCPLTIEQSLDCGFKHYRLTAPDVQPLDKIETLASLKNRK